MGGINEVNGATVTKKAAGSAMSKAKEGATNPLFSQIAGKVELITKLQNQILASSDGKNNSLSQKLETAVAEYAQLKEQLQN